MASPTEDLNRLNRAIPIVFALIASRIESVDASKSNQEDWTLAAHLADMWDYVPGKETQALIIRLLVDYEKMRQRIQPGAHSVTDAEGQYLKWSAQQAVQR